MKDRFKVNINFNLRDAITDPKDSLYRKPTAIHAVVRFNKNRVVISSIDKIEPCNWEPPLSKGLKPKNNIVYNSPKSGIRDQALRMKVERVRSNLKTSEVIIQKAFDESTERLGSYPTTKEQIDNFRELCKRRIKGLPDPDKEDSKDTKSSSFFEYIESYIKDAECGKRMIKESTNERRYSDRSIKGYTTTLNTLKDFRNQHRFIDLDFNDVTIEFYKAFEIYVKSKEFSKNYFGSFVKYIKKFMKESLEEGFHNNQDFKRKDFLKVSVESESVALSIPQLHSIASYDFTENKCYDNARDLFLVGAWTGLRYSDFSRLTRDFVDGDFIDIKTQKTGKTVVVPILPELRKILNKYKGTETGFPRAISDVKLNLYIKDICKIIGEKSNDKSFIEDVTTTIKRTDKKVTTKEPLYKLISSHTGRRSFATNAVRLKIPTESIKQITGHKTDAAFFKYVKIEPREHAIAMMEVVMRNKEMEVVNNGT